MRQITTERGLREKGMSCAYCFLPVCAWLWVCVCMCHYLRRPHGWRIKASMSRVTFCLSRSSTKICMFPRSLRAKCTAPNNLREGLARKRHVLCILSSSCLCVALGLCVRMCRYLRRPQGWRIKASMWLLLLILSECTP